MEVTFSKIVSKCKGCDILSKEKETYETCRMCFSMFCKDCKYICKKCEDCQLLLCGSCWNKKNIFEIKNKYMDDIHDLNNSFTKCGRCMEKYPKDISNISNISNISDKYKNYKSIYETLAIRVKDSPEKRQVKQKLLDFFNVYKQNFTILQEAEDSFRLTLKDLIS